MVFGQVADAIYEYGLRGNLREAKIVDDLGADPYQKWLDDNLSPAVVQTRTFDYDAAGRLQFYETPEEGQVQVLSYNAASTELETSSGSATRSTATSPRAASTRRRCGPRRETPTACSTP